MNEVEIVKLITVWILPVIFAITVHEVAHGWVAKIYGDNTAFQLGRLTLNPIKHVDLIGTVIIPGFLILTNAGFVFGWAKPVPVDDRHFKNPRKTMAIVALAGPIANIIMAIGWALIARTGVLLQIEFMILTGIAGIKINLVLALLNMLPIPPLDGSRIVAGFLPKPLAWQYYRFERYGFFVLLALLMTGGLSYILGAPLAYALQIFVVLAGLQ